MPCLDGKIALVTGSGRGIGLGCALELARAGATILLNDRPDRPDLDAAVDAVRQLGQKCVPLASDVFTRAGCESLVARSLDLFGRIDILVSNPAWSRRAAFLDCDPETFEQVIAGTLTAGFHLSQLVARHMVARGHGGKIVFISSVQAEMPLARSAPYNAAKAGLNHLARTIAAELAQHRINVNVIEPGWIDTPGERAAFGDDVIAEQGPQLPWGRLGTPADIGRTAAFLCSPDADYITGTVLAVDGGFRLKDCRAAQVIGPAVE
jgi:glucose 1-dehydrogenase